MVFVKNLMDINIFLFLMMLIIVIQGCCNTYTGPISDHFDGSQFFNKEPDHTFSDMLKWMWEMDRVEWPEWVEDPNHPAPVACVKDGNLRVTYINHATLLIQMDGLNILTDPIWSERAGPVSWAGPKRVRAPGIKMEELSKIDIILISHDHFDHLDLPSLKRLVKDHQPVILVGLGVKGFLNLEGINNVIEMDWWQEFSFSPSNTRVTFVPARHNSGRMPFNKNRTLWGGFVIQGSSGMVYFSGDTAYGQFLHSIKERFNSFRLAIFPIGSYEKRWFMKTQHMNPEDAVLAHLLLGVKQSVGMHFGTFREHPEQTIDVHEKDLLEAIQKHNLKRSEFWILEFGEGRDVP